MVARGTVAVLVAAAVGLVAMQTTAVLITGAVLLLAALIGWGMYTKRRNVALWWPAVGFMIAVGVAAHSPWQIGMTGALAYGVVLAWRSERLRAWDKDFSECGRVLGVVNRAVRGLMDEDARTPRVRVTRTKAGIAASVRVPAGLDPARVAALAPVIGAELEALDVYVKTARGTVDFLVQIEDPLEGESPASVVLAGDPMDVADPVTVGTCADGLDASVNLWAQTVLVGGSPGAGKSAFLWTPLMAAALDPSAIVVMLDLKPGGLESAPIHERADYVATTTEQARQCLAQVWQEIQDRNQRLLSAMRDKAPKDERAEFPPVVVVVDEAAELTRAADDHGKEALALLTRIVAVGRASGVSVLLCTQKPDSSVLPTALRDLMAQRVCFRVGNREQAQTILGPVPEGVEPWRISTDTPGRGVIIGADGVPSVFQSAYLSREDVITLGATAQRIRAGWVQENPSAQTMLPPVILDDADSAANESKKPRRRRRREA